MRVIGGQWKGRRIQPPSKKWPVRPTTDFAREALFNILDNKIEYESIAALDLFGGTGIHSVELASRGCANITYVDRYRDSVKFMKDLVKEWDLPVTVIQADVFAFLKKTSQRWEYIFADPPYDFPELEELASIILNAGILNSGGLFVFEHIAKRKFDHLPGFVEKRQYGQTVFSFFNAGS